MLALKSSALMLGQARQAEVLSFGAWRRIKT